ncbi:MAG: flavodoxin [Treponemataceae bacterium]|nr:flavodoxin [Treponemataceae bacterium]
MKKFISSILIILGVTTMVNAKSMVIYFSRADENYSVGTITEGNTAKVAKIIAAETQSDIWEIKPVNAYPKNYKECINVAQKEQREKARPAFEGEIPDLSGCDTIYLGSPNWWGDFPMIVYTFLEKANLEGKTIRLFVTHEGSGSGGLESSLKKAEPKANVTKSLAIRGTTAQNDKAATEKAVKGWL